MPQRLAWLLETKQALEVIPGVLYFASIAEKLPPVEESLRVSTPKQSSLSVSSPYQGKDNDVSYAEHIEQVAATAALDVSLKDVTKRVSLVSTVRPTSQKQQQTTRDDRPESASGRTSPHMLRRTRSAATRSLLLCRQLLADSGHDSHIGAVLHEGAFFFSVSESPSFAYKPYANDFGPLDLSAVTRLSGCLEGLLRRSADYDWNGTGGAAVFGPRDTGTPRPPKSPMSNGCLERSMPSLEISQAAGSEMPRSAHWTARSDGDGRVGVRTVPIVFCSQMNNPDRANAACLLACFCVAALRWSAAATWRVFQQAYPPVIPFRDASLGMSTYSLTLLDVISGLEKGVQFGWYDVQSFDLAEYGRLKRLDCSWIVPHVFLAFSSPKEKGSGRSVKMFAKVFKQLHITHVVRLNESLYNREKFLANGVRHVDLEFPDKTAPNDDVVTRFMRVAESILLVSNSEGGSSMMSTFPPHLRGGLLGTQSSRPKTSLSPTPRVPTRVGHHGGGGGGAIAMHCDAGIGRTGTLICVYIMQHYGLTARECIGWIRLCRPGSVLGAQQQFLETLERRLTRPARCVDLVHTDSYTHMLESGAADGVNSFMYTQHGLHNTLAERPVPLSQEDSAARNSAERMTMTGTITTVCDSRFAPQGSFLPTPGRSSLYFHSPDPRSPSPRAFGQCGSFSPRRPRTQHSEATAPFEMALQKSIAHSAGSGGHFPAASWRIVSAVQSVGPRGEGLAAVNAAARLFPNPVPAGPRRPATGKGPGWGEPVVRLGV